MLSTPGLTRPTRSARRGRDVRALFALTLVTALFPLVAVAGAGAAGPMLTVTPSEMLLDGQSVQVDGSGMPPDAFAVVECVAGATDVTGCQVGPLATVRPDPAGSFSTSLTVSRFLFVGTDHVVRCGTAAGTCVVAILAPSASLPVIASAPLAFDPAEIDPNPQIVVTPAAGLRAGQSVTVTGSGFVQGRVRVGQCVGGEQQCLGFIGVPDVVIRPDGTFTTSLAVSLRVFALGREDNCLAVSCQIRAVDDADKRYTALATLQFDPDQPLPRPPTISVSPDIDLEHDQLVTITGAGFEPFAPVDLSQCSAASTNLCDDNLGSANADAGGTFVATVSVRRLTAMFQPSTGLVEYADCAEAGLCFIAASELVYGGQTLRALADITFTDTVAPPPFPVVTAAPSENLPPHAVVVVRGTGFVPGDTIRWQRCAVALSLGFCEDPDPSVGIVDATGAVTFPAIVRRALGAEGTVLDCVDPEVQCALSVASSRSFQRTQVPLTFDASQPLPPLAATVTPNTGLSDLESVAIHATEVLPGPVFISECAATPVDGPSGCLGPVTVEQGANGAGTLDAPYQVHQIVEGAGIPTTDCAAAVGTCLIVVEDNYGDAVQVPLGFSISSPNLPTLALRSVKVTEGTGGVTAAPVGVELNGPAPGPVVIQWKAVPGTATSADYTAATGTITIPTGASGGTIPAEVVADALDERTERFAIMVETVTGATVEDGSAHVKIKDDDREPRVTLGDSSVAEGDVGTATVNVPVLLNGPSGRDVVVEYRTHHGSARSGSDFVRTRGEITIPAGWSGGSIAIPIVGDRRHERTESLTVEITEATNAEISDDTAKITISDND